MPLDTIANNSENQEVRYVILEHKLLQPGMMT